MISTKYGIITKDVLIHPKQTSIELNHHLRLVTCLGIKELVIELLSLGADPNVKDCYGYTCMHWAVLSRQIRILLHLKTHGGDIFICDNHSISPMDLLLMDLNALEKLNIKDEKYIPLETLGNDMMTWGSTLYFALGHEISMRSPEIGPRKVKLLGNFDITHSAVSQYHTVAISQTGAVYSWGLGEGGKLGYSNETQITPLQIASLSKIKVIRVSVSRNHTALVTSQGQLYTFGKGEQGQLGLGPDLLCTHKPKLVTTLKYVKIVDVVVSLQHSCALTDEGILYTFGNGTCGQLGHPSLENLMIPNQFIFTKTSINLVAVSNALTVILGSNMGIYYFGLGNPRPQRVKFIGYKLHTFTVREIVVMQEIFFMMIDSNEFGRQIYEVVPPNEKLKNKNSKQSEVVRVIPIFSFPGDPIRQLYSNDSTLFTITSSGRVFTAERSLPTKKDTPCLEPTFIEKRLYPELTNIVKLSVGTHHSAALIKKSRLPISQSWVVSDDTILADRIGMLNDISTDVKIICADQKFIMAHSLILSRMNLFRTMLSEGASITDVSTLLVIKLPHIHYDALKYFLHYLYTNSLLSTTDIIKSSVSSLCHHLRVRNIFSQKSGKTTEKESLLPLNIYNEQLLLVYNQRMPSINYSPITKDTISKMPFLKPDVVIHTADNQIKAHSLIIMNRCDYFKMILNRRDNGANWSESLTKEIDLKNVEGGSKVIWPLINYLYTDSLSEILDSPTLSQIALLADRFLLPRFRELCLFQLTRQITVQNTPQLLQLASIFDSAPFYDSILCFMTINLDLFLSSKIIYSNSPELKKAIDDIEIYYHKRIPNVQNLFFTSISRLEIVEEFIENSISQFIPIVEEEEISPFVVDPLLELPIPVPIAEVIPQVQIPPEKIKKKKWDSEYEKLTPLQRKELKEAQKTPKKDEDLQKSEEIKPKDEGPVSRNKQAPWGTPSKSTTTTPSLIQIQEEQSRSPVPVRHSNTPRNIPLSNSPPLSSPTNRIPIFPNLKSPPPASPPKSFHPSSPKPIIQSPKSGFTSSPKSGFPSSPKSPTQSITHIHSPIKSANQSPTSVPLCLSQSPQSQEASISPSGSTQKTAINTDKPQSVNVAKNPWTHNRVNVSPISFLDIQKEQQPAVSFNKRGKNNNPSDSVWQSRFIDWKSTSNAVDNLGDIMSEQYISTLNDIKRDIDSNKQN